MENKLLKVGIVGCGTVTQRSYVASIPKLTQIKISHVFDLNESNAKKVAQLVKAEIIPLQEMKKLVDAVIIATPPGSHYHLVKESLEPGKMVICEKPFVGLYKHAIELNELALANNSKLFVAHFRRVFPHVQLVRSIATTGVMGKVLGFKIIEGGRFNWDTSSGYLFSDPLGGVLFDTGSHSIDMALYAANLDRTQFEIKLSQIERDRAEPSHEIKVFFEFETDNSKGSGKIHLSRYRSLANMISIKFEQGTLEFSPNLSSGVRLLGKNSSTVISPNYSYSDYGEPFTEQYRQIFSDQTESIFSSDRFLNLTKILEIVSNG